MAIKVADGFPYDYNLMSSVWSIAGNFINDGNTVTTGGRFGGRKLRIYSGYAVSGGVKRIFGGSATEIIVQYGYFPFAGSYQIPVNRILTLENSDGIQVSFKDDNGTIKAYRGATLIATATSIFTPASWYQLEFRVKIDSSAGTIHARLGEVDIINLTGLNTQGQSTATVDRIGFFEDLGGGSGNRGYAISDLIVMDTSGSYCNDLLGNRMVQIFVPTAQGTYTDSTPSSGTRASTIDEIPPSATDYNTLAASGDHDSFTFASLGVNQTQIDAVVCTMYCKKTEVGAASVKGLARTGTTDGYGNVVSVADSDSYVNSIIYVDPTTTAPFTRAGFNAAEFGYKRDS